MSAFEGKADIRAPLRTCSLSMELGHGCRGCRLSLATVLLQAPVAERPHHVLPPEWQKEHSELGSQLPSRQGQFSDREVLDFLHRALFDIQQTSARTLAAVTESYDLIRFADNLSNPLYRSADTIHGNLMRPATRPIPSSAMEDAVSSHRFNIGQSVNYASGPFGVASGSGIYKITQLLPPEGDDFQYKIKSAGEPHERVVKESQLDRAG